MAYSAYDVNESSKGSNITRPRLLYDVYKALVTTS